MIIFFSFRWMVIIFFSGVLMGIVIASVGQDRPAPPPAPPMTTPHPYPLLRPMPLHPGGMP